MKFVKCPDCGAQISRRSSNCPNCGCPTSAALKEDPSGFKSLIGIILTVIMVSLLVIASRSNSDKDSQNDKKESHLKSEMEIKGKSPSSQIHPISNIENCDIKENSVDRADNNSEAVCSDAIDEEVIYTQDQNIKERFENATEVTLEGLSDSIKLLINNE